MIKPQYILSKLRTIEFSTRAIQDSINEENLSYQLNIGFGFSKEEKTIVVSSGYMMFSTKENQKPEDCFLSIKNESHFFVFNFDDFVLDKTELEVEERIDLNLARTLLAISFSTLRGSLHSKTEGSYYNKFFIPILDIAEIFPGKK